MTACSSEYDFESKYNQETEREKVFNEIFVETFGEPDAYHTWGFERPAVNETRAAYPNGNQWAAQGYNVPDPLTEGQKLRVQYYFQMVKNPGGTPDNGQIDFFMQQVYDGGTDPMDGKSPERYLAADNSTYIESGEHMDKLTAGSDNEHVNNFNNGNCGAYANVLDNGGDLNNGPWHSDQIMLMLNTKTDCFGYANSDASYVRTDRWRLVSYEVIDAYCDNAANGYEAWREANHNNIADDKVTDEWKRSFIGFDFDMIPDESCYTGNDVWVNKENPNYPGEQEYAGKTYTEYDYYRYDLYGEKYHYLRAEQNQYCGEFQTHDPEPDEVTAKELLDNGWLPVINSSNKKWVKIGGCADGYYSDWIVSFMPADGSTVVETPDYYSRRVIAEDLGTVENTDFDYNDVVFDVVQDEVNTTLTLRAAGGTLPLRLIVVEDGYETDDKLKITDPTIEAGTNHILFNREVHEWFGVDTKVMVNTYTGKHTEYEAKTYSFTNNAVYADQVRIYVQKNGEWYEITAYIGKPAQKIAAGTDYEWLDERESIITSTRQIYNNFLKFVENQKEWGKDSYKKWYQANPKYEDEDSTGTIDTNF